jgi:hypothetical protein
MKNPARSIVLAVIPFLLTSALPPILLSIAVAADSLLAQTVIENPAKPMAKDAGRIIALAEVWRITDEAGGFYFKSPRDLRIAADGSIFVADAEQLLRFSPGGKFLNNLFKKGQGPGEIGGNWFNYLIHGRDLLIMDMSSRRFWRADFDGRFQAQISQTNRDYGGFIGVLPDGFLFPKAAWPPPEDRTGKLLEILETVVLVAKDGTDVRDIVTFRPKTFLAPNAGMAWDPSMTKLSPDGEVLYGVHSRDYVIEIVDVSAGTIIKRISRRYSKVPHVELDHESEFRKKYGSPKLEFEPDINDIYPVEENLWVVTSTNDKTKGRLIDVIDKDGRFIDSFYLGAGRTLMAVRKDAVYCQEKSADEAIAIVKYRIEK